MCDIYENNDKLAMNGREVIIWKACDIYYHSLDGLIDPKAPSNPKAAATTQMTNKQEPVSKKV